MTTGKVFQTKQLIKLPKDTASIISIIKSDVKDRKEFMVDLGGASKGQVKVEPSRFELSKLPSFKDVDYN